MITSKKNETRRKVNHCKNQHFVCGIEQERKEEELYGERELEDEDW